MAFLYYNKKVPILEVKNKFVYRGLQSLFRSDEGRYYASGGSRAPYLAFADDILIFARGSEDCLTELSSLFERYQAYSGQLVRARLCSQIRLQWPMRDW